MSSSNSSFLMGSATSQPRSVPTVELAVGGIASLEVVPERSVLAVVVLDHV